MSWLPLTCFHDPAVPKLDNLRRAAADGLRVPPTCWLPADEIPAAGPAWPRGLGAGPLIVRSASPTEDTRTTSHAGQLLSLIVAEPAAFAGAVRRVADALPHDGAGRPRGAVFVQPVVAGAEAGVAFFDGFYFERTVSRAAGGRGALNVGLTAGRERGAVTRGHLERRDGWSAWLSAVYAVFGPPAGDRRLDVEWARDAAGYILLQVRPALFPVFRNELLTRGNVHETFGDPPSPWSISMLIEAGRGMAFMHYVDPVIAQWEEDFAIEVAGRIWINATFWYRFLDWVGLRRTMLSASVGAMEIHPGDDRVSFGRLLSRLPRLARYQWVALRAVLTARRDLEELDPLIDRAAGLEGLNEAARRVWVMAIHTAIAIAGLCSVTWTLRRALGVRGAARLVTQDMMEEYRRLGEWPDASAREAGLDVWLARYGHRGPGESDVARPRFAELRDVLLEDLLRRPAAAPPPRPSPGRRLLHALLRPFYLIDERREWFRSECMRRAGRLRTRLLEEGTRLVAAGRLDAPEDVFFLRGEDVAGPLPLREAAARNRAGHEAARALDVPQTATREEITAHVARSERRQAEAPGRRVFAGIPLAPAVIEGRARKAEDLVSLLSEDGKTGPALGPDTILVVPALEPSWAVLFPRVGGVVAEVGGELSHASILLREAGRPALVNVTGIFRAIHTGDRLRLDGRRGVVEVLESASASDGDRP
jgi:pyruvate,water dikinase